MKIGMAMADHGATYAVRDCATSPTSSASSQPTSNPMQHDAADDGAVAVSISAAGKLALEAGGANESAGFSSDPAPAAHLDQLLVALLSGRKVLGVSAADLQAVRDSGANSDLLLARIERAALRAGFGIERRIPQELTTPDQTTFQAKGVIRTAHDS